MKSRKKQKGFIQVREPLNLLTPQQLRDLGYLLVDDFTDVDPAGNPSSDSQPGINECLLQALDAEQPVWFSSGGVYLCEDYIAYFLWDGGENLVVHGGGGDLTPFDRPKLVLKDGAANYNAGGGAERPFVIFRQFDDKGNGAPQGTYPSDPMDNSATTFDSEDPPNKISQGFRGQANVLFDSTWENIDIDCGVNSDAIGIYSPTAQRCYLGEMTIDCSNARGGIWGIMGRNSPMQNIKVIGGEFQIRNGPVRTAEGSAGSTIAGLTLIGDSRTVQPIQNEDFVPLTIVGFDITQTNSNPIWTADTTNNTGYATIVMIDGRITTGGGTVFDNAEGHTCYLRNIYISGTDNVVQSGSQPLITRIGAWKRINEYVYTDQTSTDSPNRKYKTNSLIDGSVTSDPEPATSIDASVPGPTVDYPARHSINVPRVDSGPFENIEDHGAVGTELEFGKKLFSNDHSPPLDESASDSLGPIEAAMLAAEVAGHNRVVMPRGSFGISDTLSQRKDTIWIGISSNVCRLFPLASWRPTSNVFMMQTADDASGTCHHSNIGIVTRKKDGSGQEDTSTKDGIVFEFDNFSWINWRTGRNSTSMVNVRDREFTTPGTPSGPVKRYFWSGNGGGKHYAIGDAGGRTFGPDPARAISVIGTTEPLHIYGFNCETSKAGSPETSSNIDVIGASNVRFYGNKREGNARTFTITDSDNIAAYGLGRQGHKVTVVDDQHLINGSSTNILFGISIIDQADISPTTDGNPKQDVDSPSGAVQINWPEGCSVYKLGTIDDSKVVI